MENKSMKCIQCHRPFSLSGSEKEYLRAMGFAEPDLCPFCRKKESMVVGGKERRRNHDKKKHFRRKYEM